ncbi:MAG: hypothetical protein EPN56_00910 [Rhodanobacter sp.]|nr:MAG: hypothetical protein EPN78_06430 [Rhodanobacter sp.]TAM37546.1 MAG: hypothetical protein EPN56_00910 [Rhodanobacter sp.]
MLFATQGRNAATSATFAGDPVAHGGDAEAITDVSLDLGATYQAGAREHCPNAAAGFDPFHVVLLANVARPVGTVQAAPNHDREAPPGWHPGTLPFRAQQWPRRRHQRPYPSRQGVCGYGTDRHLIAISYLICANLRHLPKNSWTHAVQRVAA